MTRSLLMVREIYVLDQGRDHFRLGLRFICQHCKRNIRKFGHVKWMKLYNPLFYHLDWDSQAQIIEAQLNETPFNRISSNNWNHFSHSLERIQSTPTNFLVHMCAYLFLDPLCAVFPPPDLIRSSAEQGLFSRFSSWRLSVCLAQRRLSKYKVLEGLALALLLMY